jgi:AraC family transcriptional activator of pobA
MAKRASRGITSRVNGVERIDFHATKYGRELLVDCRAVHEMPAFIVDRPHALSFYDIILITRGRGTFWLDATPFRVRPNTVICTTPGQIRNWDVPKLDGMCLFFPALFLEEFFNDASFLYRLPFFHGRPGEAARELAPTAARRLRARMSAMRGEIVRLKRDSVHLLRASLYETLITLARAYAPSDEAGERSASPLALRYRDAVQRQATKQHSVAQYARDLAVSPGHLNSICKRHLGRGAKEIIEEQLVVEARRLLLYSDETASRVALRLGFKDPSYFSRFFRRASGCTPSDFRTRSLPPMSTRD